MYSIILTVLRAIHTLYWYRTASAEKAYKDKTNEVAK